MPLCMLGSQVRFCWAEPGAGSLLMGLLLNGPLACRQQAIELGCASTAPNHEGQGCGPYADSAEGESGSGGFRAAMPSWRERAALRVSAPGPAPSGGPELTNATRFCRSPAKPALASSLNDCGGCSVSSP